MSVYLEAANIIKRVNAKKASVKSLIYGSKTKNKKALYALVCESLKYQDVLRGILTNTRLLDKEKGIKKNADLAIVLLYEHILGKRLMGYFKECLARHKTSIHSQCELLKVKHNVTNLKQLVQDSPGSNLPKYVRVNTLKTTCDKVVQTFKEEGRTLLSCSKKRDVAANLSAKCFMVDPHVPDLLVFGHSTDFHKHRLYTSGEIILQDKASCFPAYILSPTPGSHAVDCCAAPGNKTSHLACLMQNKGKVYAFDKDKKRLETLRKLTLKAGATCIEATCADFLKVNPADGKYKNVQYVLVDPSCSGSGMINRTSQHTDETESCSKERLKQLAKFQTSILTHALSFPAVKKVVYSTCSVHEEENEQVVGEVLSCFGDKFELLNLEPDWPVRGVKGYEHGQCCLRMSHDSCLTNGFFVACFQSKETFCEDNDGPNSQVSTTKNSNIQTENAKSITCSQKEVNLSDSISEINGEKKGKKKKRKLDNVCEMQTDDCIDNKRTKVEGMVKDIDSFEKDAVINGDKRNLSMNSKLTTDHANVSSSANKVDERPSMSPIQSVSLSKANALKKKKRKRKKAKQIVT